MITSEKGDAQHRCSAAKFLIQGGQRQFETLGQFQVCGIIKSKPMAFGESHRCRPCLLSSFLIKIDGQITYKPGELMTPHAIQTTAPFSHSQAIKNL